MPARWKWCALLIASPLAAQAPQNPHALIDAAVTAMGGADRLHSLNRFRMQGAFHEYQVGNAERAEGPWRTSYARFSELWDAPAGRVRRTLTNTMAAPTSPGAAEQVNIVTDSVMASMTSGQVASAYPGFFEDFRDRIDGVPSQLLLTAAASSSLRLEAPVIRFGVSHDVVSISTSAGPVRIELDRDSHLPTAVELVRNYPWDFRRGIFGDVTTRIEYADWTMQPDGFWWPLQHRFLLNGELFRDLTLTRIEADVAAPADSFVVADSTRADFVKAILAGPISLKLGAHPEPPQPGGDIVRVADQWAMTMVKQGDGVVIFEAHLSDNWFKQIVAEAHQRWPGAPIKAVVLTSDPWAHLGGLREAVAMGLPIYVSARSIPFLTSLVKRPWTIRRDDLAVTPKAPRFIGVSARTSIGTGKNRIELYPVRGAYAERMTMAYFPERHLLYGADLIFPDRAPPGSPPLKTFLATPATELRRAVAREGLAVDSLFCVQARFPIFAWKDFIPTGAQP